MICGPILNLIKTRQQAQPTQPSFQEWILPNGIQWATFHRLENEYLIRFCDLADFILSQDGKDVAAYPVPGVSNQTIEHLYLNLVVPLALSRQSKLVLHGSAVEVDDFAVAFLGTTGQGKSTLAAGFSTSGYRFLTDDGLVLEKSNPHYLAQPNHPSIRLWDDSRAALIPGSTSTAPPDYTPKARLLADERVAFCNQPRPLHKIYFLGEGNTDAVSITQIRGRDAMIEMEKHSFLLYKEEPELLTNHFQQIATLANQPIFYRLDYPRRYEALPHVRETIVKHARENVLPQG